MNATLLLGALLALDAEVRESVQGWRGGFGDDLSAAAKRPGDWQLMLPLVAAGSLLGGWLASGGDGVARGMAVIAGTVAGSGTSELLNQALGRGRPAWGSGPFDFQPFSGHASFPSGHAAFAFGVAGSLDAVTESAAVAAIAYGVAGVTAVSRVYDDRHWVSDVVVGSVLSALVARRAASLAATTLGAGRREEAQDPRLSLMATPSGAALRLAF